MASRMKRGQEFIGVNHHQLSAFLCRFDIHAFGLEPCAKAVPVGERRHQDDALSVRETSTGEPTDGAVKKILVLVELHNVIAWGGVRHHCIPGLTVYHQCLRSGRPQHSRRNRRP
jgi:hypothetical protein